ncbi:hypothetical protein Pyn_40008 [Prunus yedoensis var. nudiflora]|uniref:Uncharacterized protein n=1 Tax=Prunus yedoensis var. nudiflora TaxID=2094558 RepID=A0A314UDW7_PRUYE|nr:hypothetical protein Pyn_40008 [Prunus yedoensis var. nudiflora]
MADSGIGNGTTTVDAILKSFGRIGISPWFLIVARICISAEIPVRLPQCLCYVN